MIRYMQVFAEELGRICRGGEEILEAISAMYSPGRETTAGDVNTVTFDPINGLSVEAWNAAALQAIGGLTLDVRRGRQARHLADAASNPLGYLVLSTERLMVIDGLANSVTPRVTWSTELGSVAVLRHDPRVPLEMGRLLVGFLDGSLVRLRAGLLLPLAAPRLAASFHDTTGR